MTTQQAAQLARRAWLARQEHKRLVFARWLVRHSHLTDFPEQPDLVECWCARMDEKHPDLWSFR